MNISYINNEYLFSIWLYRYSSEKNILRSYDKKFIGNLLNTFPFGADSPSWSPSAFKRLICLMICLAFTESCSISTAAFDEYNNADDSHMTVISALDYKRLKEIRKHPSFTGTGGPRIPLPDGNFVNRDNIFEAIQPLIKQKYSVCPDLLRELKNDHVHIRYGAYLALEKITESEIPYYPFFPKNHPKNLEGYEKWKNYIMKLPGAGDGQIPVSD